MLIPARLRLVLPALAFGLLAFASIAFAAAPATYDYPDQPGRDTLRKGDPDLKLLADSSDDTAVWGAWDVKPFIADWAFASPVRIRLLRVAIEHPVDPTVDSTHPRMLHLFVADEAGKFEAEPHLTLPIPFEAGQRQIVTLQLPGDGLVAKRLRTHFEGSNRQVVIGEVTFDAQPATDADLRAALKAAADSRAAPLKPVDAPPVGLLENIPPPPASSIFGAAGHMLHTDHFYPDRFSKYWRLEYTLPFVQQLGIASVREPIYQDYFFADDPAYESQREINRKLVEDYIALYDRAGVNVVICAILGGSGDGGTPGGTTLKEYCQWIADMAKRYPCIEAVELGNEPNLPPFWQHTFQEYVDSARVTAQLLREFKPDLPIIVGSFSGMGGVWMRPDLLAEAGPDEADQSIHWARKVFEAGLLEFADGVSTHPYNESNTQPEGGVFLQSRKDPSGYEKELRDFWDLVQSYNTTKRPLKLYFTELGYEITTGRDPEWQADYLSRLMLILFSTRVSGSIPLQRVHWYDLKEDDAIVGASGWGLVRLNATHVRPAFTAYQRVAKFFGNTDDFEPAGVQPEFSNWPEIIKHFTWRRKSDGVLVVAFWRMEQLQKRPVDFESELTLTLPESFGKPSRIELVDLHAAEPQALGFEATGGTLRTAVNVTDRAAWIVIHP